MPEIEKLNAEDHAPGPKGEALAIGGDDMALRVWNEGPVEKKELHASDHETLGFVIGGEAVLHGEDKSLHLMPGDSWRVPKGVMHGYEIPQNFRAVEVTSPPARDVPRASRPTMGLP